MGLRSAASAVGRVEQMIAREMEQREAATMDEERANSMATAHAMATAQATLRATHRAIDDGLHAARAARQGKEIAQWGKLETDLERLQERFDTASARAILPSQWSVTRWAAAVNDAVDDDDAASMQEMFTETNEPPSTPLLLEEISLADSEPTSRARKYAGKAIKGGAILGTMAAVGPLGLVLAGAKFTVVSVTAAAAGSAVVGSSVSLAMDRRAGR